MAMDLAHPEARGVLEDLLRRADVLVENLLPDSADRLGLSPGRLAEINPQLVSCSISGFGRTGERAGVPGYDLVIQAMYGIMSITGEPDRTPMKVGVAITDVVTGLYAAVCAVAGLAARGKNAGPWSFDLALADCTLASLVNVAQGALLTGELPKRYGNAHPQIVPYEAFATADGHLVLAVGNDRQWGRFCEGIGRPDWSADPRFADNPSRVRNRETLIPLVAEVIQARTTADWKAFLTALEIPHGPVRGLDEVFADPQTISRGMVQEATDGAGEPFRLLGSAVHWANEASRSACIPPRLGQNTEDVLAEWLAYNAERIGELVAKGVVWGA